jgi:hypothetical protein
MPSAKEIKQAVQKTQDQKNRKKEKATFFGQEIYVVEFSSFEAEACRAYEESPNPEIRNKATAKICQVAIRDENYNYIYGKEDVDVIASFWPAKELAKIKRMALRINGQNPEGLEDILKNLVETLGEDGLLKLREITDAQLQNFSKDTQQESLKSNGS